MFHCELSETDIVPKNMLPKDANEPPRAKTGLLIFALSCQKKGTQPSLYLYDKVKDGQRSFGLF